MNEYSDKELAHFSGEGDVDAFNTIVTKYNKSVYNFVFRLMGDRDEAFDLTQEVFIKIWKNIHKYDGRASLKTWIFKISRNTTIDWLRKRKPILFSNIKTENNESFFEEDILDLEPLADELFEQNELALILERALENVSLEQKTIVILHYKEGLTFEEISEILGKPMNTVKSTYRRALKILKKYLESAPK